MKKLISLLLVILISSSLLSCSSPNKETVNSSNKTTIPPQTYVSFSERYYTFEDACKSADLIIIGKFVDFAPPVADYRVFEFEVIDTIFGEASDTVKIYLHGTKNNHFDKETKQYYSFAPRDAGFYGQRTYLIPLKIVDSVYQDYPYAYPIGSALVDINDISQSQMYGKYIQQHATGIDFSKSTAEEIINYAKELSKNNSISKKTIYTDSIEEIINISDKIVHIKVNEFKKKTQMPFYEVELYECTVIDNLKGEFDKDSEITIIFFDETVKVGEEYIVMLAPGGMPDLQQFSAKRSLRDVSEKETIKDILGIVD